VVGITGEGRQARVAKMTNKNGSEMTKELKKDLKTHGQYGEEDCFLVHETK